LPLTVANKGERIYIDTMVLVYYFYTKQHKQFSEQAKRFLQRVENNKFEGVISSVTLMELIKVLRELLITYGPIHDMNVIESIINQQIKELYSMKHICFVEGRPPDFEPATEVEKLYYYTIINKSLKLLQTCTGKVGANYQSGLPEHSGLHPIDIMHVVLAKQLNCNHIATFEWNFREAQGEVPPLILQDNNSLW
jgi:predicted nucleic acid-binding protein